MDNKKITIWGPVTHAMVDTTLSLSSERVADFTSRTFNGVWSNRSNLPLCLVNDGLSHDERKYALRLDKRENKLVMCWFDLHPRLLPNIKNVVCLMIESLACGKAVALVLAEMLGQPKGILERIEFTMNLWPACFERLARKITIV